MDIKLKPGDGRILEFHSLKTSVVIGRSNKCDIVVPHESLSRNHCVVEYTNGEFFITDLDSANGVYVNGTRIAPSERTAFTTFQEVLLGHIELTISFEDLAVPVFQTQRHQDRLELEKTKTKTGKSKPEASKPFRAKPQSSNGSKVAILAVIAMIAGAAYYQFLVKNPESASEANTSVNIPVDLTAKDEFLSLGSYQDKEGLRSCEGKFKAACEASEMKMENGEGFAEENKELYIFLMPSAHAKNERYARIQAISDMADIVGLDMALRNPAFAPFEAKDIHQIHLLLKDENYKIFRIYRFHTQYFSKMGPEKRRLITLLNSGLESTDFTEFLSESQPIIQKQSP